MLKVAKVSFGESVVDCVVRDLSPTGIRVGTEAVIPFPEHVTIELRSGGVWQAVTRWQRGLETGFEIVRFAGLHAQAMSDASALYERLYHSGVNDVLDRLAAARFFDHDELREATQTAQRAVAALEKVLLVASGRT